MTLHELFEYLTYGELSQLAIGNLIPDATESEVHPKDYNKILSHVNLGLKALYTRFWLSSKEVIVQQYDHIQTYYLHTDYARTNAVSDKVPAYIVDSVFEPFQNDVLKIEQVFDEDGRGLYLNDLTQPWSVFTPTYNSIQIPYPMWCNHLLVQYRASHPTISMGWIQDSKNKDLILPDPRNIEISLPEGFLEPLLYYIARRVLGNLNTDNNQEADNYLQKYENSCGMLESKGLQITPHYGNTRLDDHGWV